MKRNKTRISGLAKNLRRFTQLGLVAILALVVLVVLYNSFRGDIVGHAGETLGSCAESGRYYLFDKNVDDSYRTLLKCVDGKLVSCTATGCESDGTTTSMPERSTPPPTDIRAPVPSTTSIPASTDLTVTISGNGFVNSEDTPRTIDCGSDCSETYTSGTSVTLTATPAPGSVFVAWNGPCTNTQPKWVCTITMSEERTILAARFLPAVSLTVTNLGGGVVTSKPEGINCGDDCSELYAAFAGVDLSASPSPGYTFASWSGACTGSGSCRVMLDTDKSVTASFVGTYLLTVNTKGYGIVRAEGINCGGDCSESYLGGTIVTLSASPSIGYVFTGWSGSCTGMDVCTVTMDAAKSVTATFALTRRVVVTKSGSGTVTSVSSPSQPDQINCGGDCSATYTSGTTITLTATPDPGSIFYTWGYTSGGKCSMSGQSPTCTFTISDNDVGEIPESAIFKVPE